MTNQNSINKLKKALKDLLEKSENPREHFNPQDGTVFVEDTTSIKKMVLEEIGMKSE